MNSNKDRNKQIRRQKGAFDKFLTLSPSVKEEEACGTTASTNVAGNETDVSDTCVNF